MIGQTLSHFKITAKLGEGGMGEVYRAQDTRLKREVALKVLPESLAGNPERLDRFQREAEVLAALDHPNIVTIHSVEKAEGFHFLTMQLVRGSQLSERIPARGMPLEDFFAVAIALADAISAAHAKGITHRDLKPGNVMIDDEGRVKVLDFGLAKLHQVAPGAGMSHLPTEAITGEGLVVGTVPYMSPEQAEGREIDYRSDIFSLGIVLYQMATGRAPFEGDTPLSVLSAIVRDAPQPVEQVNVDVPRHLGRIIRKCLEKDVERRYQSTRDLYNDLLDLRGEVESGVVQPLRAETPAAVPRPRWVSALASLAGVAAVVLLVWMLRGGSSPSGSVEPEWRTRRLTNLPGSQTEPSLSPDGQQFLFVDYAPSGRRGQGARSDIYTQRVGGQRPVNLTADSEGNSFHPAYSPDGQRIVFGSDRVGGGLFVMGATGENPRKIADEGFNPDWSPDGGSVVYGTTGLFDPRFGRMGEPLLRVLDLASGGTRTLVDPGRDPSWSPSGARVAYLILHEGGRRDIATVGIDGGTPVFVTDDPYLDWSPEWSPDGRYLYFASNRGGAHNIWRVGIDEETGEVLGEASSVTRGGTELQGFLSVSAEGNRIAYAARQETNNIVRVGFDPESMEITGELVLITSGPRSLGLFDISPDGDRLAAMLTTPWEDIVLMAADGSGERKLTDDPQNDRRPRFSADGERIYFYSAREGASRIWSVETDGTDLTLVTEGSDGFFFSDPSPDGNWMSSNRGGRSEIFDLTRPYPQQDPIELPRDEHGRRFAPVEWTRDSKKILGGLMSSTTAEGAWALYDLESGGFQPLGQRASALDSLTLADPKGIYIGTSETRLMLYDDRSGEVRELLSVAPVVPRQPRVSPDGRTIYFLRESASSDIHLLELENGDS